MFKNNLVGCGMQIGANQNDDVLMLDSQVGSVIGEVNLPSDIIKGRS